MIKTSNYREVSFELSPEGSPGSHEQTKYTDYMTSGCRDARQLPFQEYPALA